jgi:hypothetical protein
LADDVFRGLYEVTFADGLFVAAGTGQLATSTDGMHWRKRDPGHNTSMSSITYGQNTFLSILRGTQIWQSDSIIVF